MVLQAVIMILGHKYMSDRSLHIVFDKKTTITRIKTWNRCKLNRHKICKIKNWMEFRPQTFGEVAGYKGDKLLHALRDWCLIMVENRKPIKKAIATAERQTQSSLSPKSIPKVQTSKATKSTISVAKKQMKARPICKDSETNTRTAMTALDMSDKCVGLHVPCVHMGVQVGM
eukprot:487887_1